MTVYECIECGMPFESSLESNPFCSDECEERYESEAMKEVF
jgi:endogenous inhibitor of DNA gyrase (YacG/DUF329 family)